MLDVERWALSVYRCVDKSIDATFNYRLDEAMKTKPLFLFGCVALLSFTFAGTASATDTKNSAEQTIRDLEAQWSTAAGAKDLDKTVSFYSDDAIVLPANAPVATTKEAIRDVWKGLFDSPGAAMSWKPSKVEVSKSGDMAYATGSYELTMNDASGKPTTDHGKYVTVWEKQADGKWKCAADIWNSDLPASAPAEKK
jgi:uncharacterized protein (TIGR02246 family)